MKKLKVRITARMKSGRVHRSSKLEATESDVDVWRKIGKNFEEINHLHIKGHYLNPAEIESIKIETWGE